ncbi:MAG: molybdenum cofactor guanylyltransferase [Balneolales bacterium]
MTAKRTLYIPCGGRSQRMGRDKALLEFEGKPLLERQYERSKSYFNEVVLLSGTHNYQTHLRQLPDALPDAGPLGGLLAALQEHTGVGNTYIALIPVDVPKLSNETLKWLAYTVPEDDTDAIVIRSGEIIQPLAGLYRSTLAGRLSNFLGRGERRVMRFLKELSHTYVEVSPGAMENINTPEDFKRL